MTYEIRIRPSAAKAIRKLPKTEQSRIREAVEALRVEPRPRGSRKLTGGTNEWRIRVGAYRVVYEVQDDVLIVSVVRVGAAPTGVDRIPDTRHPDTPRVDSAALRALVSPASESEQWLTRASTTPPLRR